MHVEVRVLLECPYSCWLCLLALGSTDSNLRARASLFASSHTEKVRLQMFQMFATLLSGQMQGKLKGHQPASLCNT
jgi:hypothetical protein